MAIKIRGYYVFLSWQEGLEEEREEFYGIVEHYNRKRAIRRGFLFIPIDWKSIAGGYGRAQDKINLALYDCDYLIVTFWDRWGTRPDQEEGGNYSSGTEEEYYKAVECCKDDKKPMCDVVVFFKEVPPRQLNDPGDQLKKVMEFKEKMKGEGLFKGFKDIGQFRELVEDHLEEWLFKLEYPNQPPRTKMTVIDEGDGVITEPGKTQEL